MKVAILKSQLASGGGGLEKYTRRIIEAFLKKGCDLTILTTGKPQDIPTGCKVVALEKPFRATWLRLLQFDSWCRDWLSQNKMDIIFGLERNSYQTHYRAGNGVHLKFMQLRQQTDPLLKRFTTYLNPTHYILKNIEQKAYTHPDLKILFTNSYLVKGEILEYYPSVAPEKICVVHNGVEWEQWQFQFDIGLSKRTEICKQLKLDPTAFQFLFVGHGFQRKGLHFLLAGLALLNKTERNWQLAVVGQDKSRASFEALSARLGLQTQVKFYGSQSTILPFYQTADCVTIPSLYDPFANVTVEALAMGNYVVSSPYNGGKEVLNFESGSIIENLFEPEAVAVSLAQAMAHPKNFINAERIRNSIKALDFSNQLNMLIDKTLTT
ncbi:MAG: WabG [Chlamydiales bacterium]|jgi:UDP-glucose:(heptosyl)LPS alpha-1,3-glucosyltransferase|nr:WabG [Chlamydiales bacterium]